MAKSMKKGARGMKVGAARKGFYMFSRDLLSSRRYRCCSWVAKGVYLDLLNVLAVQPKPGAVCLTDFDLKPKSERSLTFRCLQCQKKSKNGEYQSIKYFAEAISVSGASGPRPGLIHGLQELYLRGMIVIEGDMLIQPRMYQDNGFRLASDAEQDEEEVVAVDSPDDSEADPDAEALRLEKKGNAKGTEKGTSEEQENAPKKSHVGARGARAQSESESKSKNNNINNNNDSKGNDARKTQKFTPPTLEEVQAYCQEKAFTFDPIMFFSHYEANGWVQGRGKPIRSWQACCTTWQRRESNGEFTNNNNGNNGRQATTTNQRGAYQGAGRNQEQEAAALREQTVRLIERNRAQRAALQADGADPTGDPF